MIGDDCQSIDSVHIISTDAEAKTTLDHFGKIQAEQDAICPRCGQLMEGKTTRHARSKYAEIMVCDTWGNIEAVEVAGLVPKKPLMQWELIKKCVS